MQIKLPKKHSPAFASKVSRAIAKIELGLIRLRTTTAYGYKTADIGGGERLVLLAGTFFTFSNHRDYDKFISQS